MDWIQNNLEADICECGEHGSYCEGCDSIMCEECRIICTEDFENDILMDGKREYLRRGFNIILIGVGIGGLVYMFFMHVGTFARLFTK